MAIEELYALIGHMRFCEGLLRLEPLVAKNILMKGCEKSKQSLLDENMLYEKIDMLFRQTSHFYCIDDNGFYSNAEIKNEANILCCMMQNNGLQSKDRVIILSNNSFFTVAVLFGTLLADIIPMPVLENTPVDKIVGYIRQIGAKAIIFCRGAVSDGDCNQLQNYVMTLVKTDSGWQVAKKTETTVMQNYCDVTPNDLEEMQDAAFILQSSGTTSAPKVNLFTHKNTIGMLNAIQSYMQPTCEDVFMVCKYPHHVSTWIGEILISIYADAALSIRKSTVMLPRRCLENVEKDNSTLLFVNPQILSKLVRMDKSKYSLDTIRAIYSSGSILDADFHKRADHFFTKGRVYNVYGLTEAGPRVFAQGPNREIKYGSVGKVVDGVYVKIVDCNIQNQCKEITEPGIVGELFVKSPYRPIVNWPDIHQQDCGYVRTNDLGYFDKDGNYFITGRNDDIILYNSHNINPNVIELCIKAFEGVEDCVVFCEKDSVKSEKLIAMYTTSDRKPVNHRELNKYLKKKLDSYECPHELYNCQTQFRSATGKLLRSKAQEYYKVHFSIHT